MDRPGGELLRWGNEQYGVASDADLRVRFSRSQVAHLRRTGELLRVQPRAYAFSVAPRSAEQALMAAVISAQPAAASHRSAAWLWEMGDEIPPAPEVAVPPNRRPRLRHVVVHRSYDVDRDAIAMRRGIPVTSPLLTLLHLGAVMPERYVQRAFNRGAAKKLFTFDEADEYIDAVGRSGKNGAGVLRRVLESRQQGGPLASELEIVALDICRRYDLPEPVFQYEIELSDTWTVSIDLAWPDHMLLVEFDGFWVHGTPEAAEDDQLRTLALVDLGYHVERFWWRVATKHAALVARRLKALLARREP